MKRMIVYLIFLWNILWVASGKGSLSKSEKQAILDNHNFYRSQISQKGLKGAHNQPTASNMLLLEWDDQLADAAHEHAKHCKWKHFVPHLSGYGQLGQNLATRSGPRYAVSAVKDWYNEVNYYSFDSVSCQSGKKCGHYKEMMYAQVGRVGCDYADCSGKGNPYPFKHYIVCNYDVLVLRGKQIYKKGSSCSACPSSHKGGCVKGLCKASSMTKNDHNIISRVPDYLKGETGGSGGGGGCEDHLSSRSCGRMKRKKACRKFSKKHAKALKYCRKTCKAC